MSTGFDLVLHGARIDASALDPIAAHCGARDCHFVNEVAIRLLDVDRTRAADATVIDFCARHRCDHALVPSGRGLRDFRLIAMDMDSTLITIECIDEIADMLGLKPQVAAITEQAMRGEIAFPESLRRRVALLAGLDQSALQRVYDERLALSAGAETMLAAARAAGIETLLVSGGFTFFTDRLQARLAIDHTRSNSLEIVAGKLTGRVLGAIVDGEGKAAAVRERIATLGIARAEVIVLGDGANDLPMMREAGVSIAYRAKPVVRAQATYAFDYAGLDGLLSLFPLR